MADTPVLASNQPSVRTVTGWTILFLVLLRIVIGWHFAYEGAWKLVQDDWRATGYLTQSIGPLRPVFLKFVEDPDGLERLTEASVNQRIDERFAILDKFYGLDDNQRAECKKYAQRKKTGDPGEEGKPFDPVNVKTVFADPDFQADLTNYKDFLLEVGAQEKAQYQYDKYLQKVETKPNAEPQPRTDYNKERLMFNYGKKAAARQALLARAEAPLKAMEANTLSKLRPEQMAKGAPPREKSQSRFSDWANMLALTAIGVCLMIGLFTRLAALGAIGLLIMYYFCMPPWPGLPESPATEGHYYIVNKNLVEAAALLVIAASGAGRWAGLDAFISAFFRKSRTGKNPAA
ncbi:MAG TPA: DoxX family protein [Phycisphaerae bacterium]|nr:DoxX family protein [Phycisphaerae bacterium]HRY68633.1 DoxX family protein [Phycisphaerae bacterium]HSA25459.1 DoxX family protein [Phycisphaerae bacterium]